MTRSLLAPALLTLLLVSASPPAGAQTRIVPRGDTPGNADATQVLPSNEVTRANWLALPNAAQFAAHMPDRARRKGRTGSAVMRCVVKDDGGLDGCVVVSETPADLGFGAAAVGMAGLFRMAPQATDGHPVAGLSITLTVEFPPV